MTEDGVDVALKSQFKEAMKSLIGLYQDPKNVEVGSMIVEVCHHAHSLAGPEDSLEFKTEWIKYNAENWRKMVEGMLI